MQISHKHFLVTISTFKGSVNFRIVFFVNCNYINCFRRVSYQDPSPLPRYRNVCTAGALLLRLETSKAFQDYNQLGVSVSNWNRVRLGNAKTFENRPFSLGPELKSEAKREDAS